MIIMDVDLQHPPELIPEMYKIVENGEYDCVGARRMIIPGFQRTLVAVEDTLTAL